MLATVLCHTCLVLPLQVLHQRNVVIDNVLLAKSASVEYHLDDLVLRVAVELLVQHVGEMFVVLYKVLAKPGEVHRLFALAAEGLDTVDKGVAEQPDWKLDSWGSGSLGCIEYRGVRAIICFCSPGKDASVNKLLSQEDSSHAECVTGW